jgi:hypothetical protein
MRLPFGIGLMVAIMASTSVGATEAQEGLTKRDGQGPVAVVVTLAAAPATGVPIKVKVALDTHSVGLDTIAFEEAVALRTPDGKDLAPTAVEAKGGGHHREAMVIFPPLTSAGPLRIVVKNVGGVAERSFVWEIR